MTHANCRLPKPTEFPARHPFRNEKNHQKLIEYLQQRLMLGKNARDERLSRIGRIDRDVAGWIIRTVETEVERDRKKTKTGQPVAMRTERRRVGKEWFSKFRFWWSQSI